MNRFKFITLGITAAFLLNSCSKVLEPVSFFGGKQDITAEAGQEEFEINIKSLTFDTAKKANNATYPRHLILTGNGSKANVSDETIFLKSSFPKPSNNTDYLLGVGDEISFSQLNEFETGIVQWPDNSKKTEYLLGAGDELSFTQSNTGNQDIASLIPQIGNTLISTQGVIGSNGNILLFGLGNILAANRTLDNVRAEVRNILIRNGLTPNFQLEISDFKSQKVYVSIDNYKSQMYFLNNIPIYLKEIALNAGLSDANESYAIIKLTRNDQEFRFTAGQLFDKLSPKIKLQDNDVVKIQIASKSLINIQSVVGSKGNILLPVLGSIPAVNRTLNDIYKEISNILIGKGIRPSFQLELTKFVSKKAYLIAKNKGSKVIPLTNSKITLRELILENENSQNENSQTSINGLSIITLKRSGQVFRMTKDQILNPKTQDIWIVDEDQIELENLAYKPGQVFALSGAGKAQVVPIDPSKRETLADILFAENGPLNNLLAKRSEVYLMRGKNPSIAYHLDAQNVSRVLVAAKTELRPNDIVYVADRPIISFTRTLAEILPLRVLLRDIQDENIP